MAAAGGVRCAQADGRCARPVPRRGRPCAGVRPDRPAAGLDPAARTGRVITGGLYRPQPPYGAATSLTLRIDDAPEAFAAAYEARLRAAGWNVRRVPPPFDFTFATDLAIEADAPAGGHTLFAVLRHNHAAQFAQLNFWNAPAPRPR